MDCDGCEARARPGHVATRKLRCVLQKGQEEVEHKCKPRDASYMADGRDSTETENASEAGSSLSIKV